MMGRRGFFKAIGAAVLGLSLALRLPEREPEPLNVSFYWDINDPLDDELMGRYIRPAAERMVSVWDESVFHAVYRS